MSVRRELRSFVARLTGRLERDDVVVRNLWIEARGAFNLPACKRIWLLDDSIASDADFVAFPAGFPRSALEGLAPGPGIHGRHEDRKSGCVFDESSPTVAFPDVRRSELLRRAKELRSRHRPRALLVRSRSRGLWIVGG